MAQHCPWDYSKIIVLRVTGTSNEIIPNLKITVLEASGAPVFVANYIGNTWVQDTLRMYKNPDKTTHKGYIDNENPLKEGSIRFWFANDNYIAVSHFGNEIKLKIEDTDGQKNGGKFADTIVALNSKDIYPLCNHFSDWDLGPEHGFVKGYEPNQVKLQLVK
jgi:hypothetical protein